MFQRRKVRRVSDFGENLDPAVTQILGYYFGSSQSSAKKQDTINTAMQQAADVAGERK